MSKVLIDTGSFKDPAGYVYVHNGNVYRHLNPGFELLFSQLQDSGLYTELTKAGLLLHAKADKQLPKTDGLTLKVPKIPFISYPYEWPFGMLKDAALLTLEIQRIALKHNLSLKDASAYNVQWFKGKPVFIDHTSFESYGEGKPWVAYRQFCEHFLGPLALWSYADLELYRLQREFIDGIPLRLVGSLLPKTTLINQGLLLHLHWHARNQSKKRHALETSYSHKLEVSKTMLLAIIDDLKRLIESFKLKGTNTEWKDYYSFTNYTGSAFEHKKKLVKQWTESLQPDMSWDLGANTGEFSLCVSEVGNYTVGFDLDPLAVEKHYQNIKKAGDTRRLALIMDLANPSPNLGWANIERKSLSSRGQADLCLALALIHHLRISLNVPLVHIAQWLSSLTSHLIVEWVPKSDSQVQKMLATRVDVYSDYSQDQFEKAFSGFFELKQKRKVKESYRWLYLWKRK